MESSFIGGVLGALRIDKELFCATLEPPDVDNKVNVSCIPSGQYLCQAIVSRRHGPTFEVCNVPDRTNVLFHPGNTIEDTAGCICLGKSWGQLGPERAILNSGYTFRNFLARLDSTKEFILTITEHY